MSSSGEQLRCVAPVRRVVGGAMNRPPEGSRFARGGTVFRGLQPSEARPSRRAKRGSTEVLPSEARPREGHREVAITKKLKKVPPESPGEPFRGIFFFQMFNFIIYLFLGLVKAIFRFSGVGF